MFIFLCLHSYVYPTLTYRVERAVATVGETLGKLLWEIVMVPGFSGLFVLVSPSLLIARVESGLGSHLCVHLYNLLTCHRWLLTCHPSSLTAPHAT